MGRKWVEKMFSYIHDTLFPNPSPYSPFDSRGGISFIHSDMVKGVKGMRGNFHVYRKEDNDLPLCIGKFINAESGISQDKFRYSSRSFLPFVKSFSKKLFIFSKKLCQVFRQLFSGRKRVEKSEE